jgi:Putative phage abortive infection protein
MEDEPTDALPKWIWFVSIGLFVAVAVFISFGIWDSSKYKELGTWGDFVGGVLNPILTFLTVIGLLITIHLQQRELKLTRHELEKSSNALEAQNLTSKQQRFENTLFSMIAVLNQIIDGMDFENVRRDTLKGRDCFTEFSRLLERAYFWRSWLSGNDRFTNKHGKEYAIYHFHDFQRSIDAYDYFWKRYQSDLGHYFRVLYNIFRYIDQSEFRNGIYSKILRAQISNQELIIIFYNCLTPRGEEFAKLAETFQLYDNMDTTRLFRPEHIKFVAPQAFGENELTLPTPRETPN